MNHSLKTAFLTITNQLTEFLTKLPTHIYTTEQPLLSDKSIGKHIRHIVEFYECIFTGMHIGVINYDARSRNIALETDKTFCIEKLQHVTKLICSVDVDKKLSLQMSFCSAEEPVLLASSLTRELTYAMEHAIHHMAIIKMAIKAIHLPIELPQNFGVAISTISYQTSAYAPAVNHS